MKKYFSTLIVLIFTIALTAQIDHIFEIPNYESQTLGINMKSNFNNDLCKDVLDEKLRNVSDIYKKSNLKEWVHTYFKSSETNRADMKSRAQSDAAISAIANNIPISFGFSSKRSKEENYWTQKYFEWSNTRSIDLDDILFVYKTDSESQIQAWLKCMQEQKISNDVTSSNIGVFLTISRLREGRYEIRITNNSIADIIISDIIIDPFVELESNTSKKFKIGETINKGSWSFGTLVSKSFQDVEFSIYTTIKLKVTPSQTVELKSQHRLLNNTPNIPIGSIISTTFSYEQFLKLNNMDQVSVYDQIWLPCDGRIVKGNSLISKTPDLRGLFLRGANIMDLNETLYTTRVDNRQRNPEEPEWGVYQQDNLKSHSHVLFSKEDVAPSNGDFKGDSETYASVKAFRGVGAWSVYNIIQSNIVPSMHKSNNSGGSETRPKNIAVNHLIKVR